MVLVFTLDLDSAGSLDLWGLKKMRVGYLALGPGLPIAVP